MARDRGLETLLSEELGTLPGLTEKAMFGGWVWMLYGNLLCGARLDGMLVRLGKGNEVWALKTPGIAPMISQGRVMPGWVWAAPEAYGKDALRRKLIDGALEFVRSLPPK
ncbi:cold-shock protein [Paraburkholderia sp. A1RI_3L]|uniref:cold-shock protein n=1 Tax=Paraburkholderia TaxID=1822464 RepID=UPI003B7819E9